MDFIELRITVDSTYVDIVMAELAEIGYDTFLETEQGVHAYISASRFEEAALQEIGQKYIVFTDMQYQFSTLEKKNWNEEWERNYQPIRISNQCLVRASFHQVDESFAYEIVINPKMSFGTGHHETTALMLENQLTVLHTRKRVLDVGCGTGILAIMAAKLGASAVHAVDTDEWAVENARENVALNGFSDITVQQGTIQDMATPDQYDIILANINRNVLLEEIYGYARLLAQHGKLLLSGFYATDMPDIEQVAFTQGLIKQSVQTKNLWALAVFGRNSK